MGEAVCGHEQLFAARRDPEEDECQHVGEVAEL